MGRLIWLEESDVSLSFVILTVNNEVIPHTGSIFMQVCTSSTAIHNLVDYCLQYIGLCTEGSNESFWPKAIEIFSSKKIALYKILYIAALISCIKGFCKL